jgi:HEPN domain-containing protein
MTKNQDTLDRRINDFARRSFRDMADRDYIAARLACRAELMPQLLWAAQQAFEKYLKHILLVNRIPAKVGHDILSALKLTEQLSFKIELRPEGLEFIKHVAAYGEYRYLDVSYFVQGHVLLDLDMAVWDLRRYCQVLDVRGKKLPDDEQRMLRDAQAMLKASTDRPAHEFRINGGFLEGVLDKKGHPAREALTWQNAFFGVKRRKSVKIKDHLQASNSPLYLYPDMLDELLKYVFIPKGLERGYRQHLEAVLADPSKRP